MIKKINYENYEVPQLNSISEGYDYIIRSYSSQNAFYKDGQYITYEQFSNDVVACKNAVSHHRNKKIGLLFDDTYYFTVMYFATVLTGNIAVLLSHEQSVEYFSAIVPIDDIVKDADVQDILSNCKTSLHLDNVICDPYACCTILFSSGTTSTPKGIMLSSNNIASDIVAGMQKYTYAKEGRYINVIPFTHAFGLVCDILAPLFSGSVICCLKNKYELFTVMPKFKPTNLNLPPVMVTMLYKLIENAQGNVSAVTGGDLKKILSGGAGTGADIVQKMRSYGINVYGCYGLSECSPCVAVNRDDYYKDGSAGIILDCNKVRIDDNDEIVISGTNVMLGYYPNKEMKGYEHHTGDLGYIDSDGFLYVTGRLDDLIVLENGIKIMPQNIEVQISSIDGVKETIVYSQNKQLHCCVVIENLEIKNDIFSKIKSLDISFVIEYHFQTEELCRNKSGKLRRNLYGR